MSFEVLWTPSTAKELICLDSDDFELYEIDDAKVEFFINQALTDWLNGKLDTGTLTDVLLEFGVDPHIIDNCESHVKLLLK